MNASHAKELRDAVAEFKQERLSLSSIERLLNEIEAVADRMTADQQGGVVIDLDDFSRKVVG